MQNLEFQSPVTSQEFEEFKTKRRRFYFEITNRNYK